MLNWENGGPKVTIEQMKSFAAKTEKNLKEFLAQQANNGSKGGPPDPTLIPGQS